MSLFATAEQWPPYLCRLVAKKRAGSSWVGLSCRDIEQLSGLPRSTVAELSYRKTWEGVPIDIVEKFMKACGVDPLRAKRLVYFLNYRQMTHTSNGSRHQVAMYTRLWELHAEARGVLT